MASLIQEKDGRRRIQFYDGKGIRRSIGLGSISDRNAERIRDKVEQLVEHVLTRTPLESDVSRWVIGLDDRMHTKLSKAGLVEARQASDAESDNSAKPASVTLEAFLDEYLTKRTDVKQSTRTVYGQVRRNLLDCFEGSKLLVDFTPGDADDFVRYLKAKLPSEVTINRRCGLARTMFRSAVRHRLIGANPFEDVKAGTRGNSARQRFITREDIEVIAEKAPDAEWRLMIALARFGGLRVPSELFTLRWVDIDWERQRIRIPSPKTEHHQGKDSRLIPLFPELLGPLQEAWDQAEPGSEYVITKNRPESVRKCNGNWEAVNLRTRFTKIIKRAGLTPWPRLWQNLRSSRETELSHLYPLHVVTAWLGNSEAVATKHYLQVTDADFDRAAVETVTAPVRKPVRYGDESSRIDQHVETAGFPKSLPCKEKRLHAIACSRSEWRIGDLNP